VLLVSIQESVFRNQYSGKVDISINLLSKKSIQSRVSFIDNLEMHGSYKYQKRG